MKAVIKPQFVDQIPKAVKGLVGDMIKRKAEIGNEDEMMKILGNFPIFFTILIFGGSGKSFSFNAFPLLSIFGGSGKIYYLMEVELS